MHNNLEKYIVGIIPEVNSIPSGRLKILDVLKSEVSIDKVQNLVFICTHNSRRSQMAQLWAYTAATYYGFKNINSFSGGTEATEFNQNALKAIGKAGFAISSNNDQVNPVYSIKISENHEPIEFFSKVYNDLSNPKDNFIAVMTCSSAEKNCPYIPGTDKRISIMYDDPKEFDGTELEIIKYDECCRQIATEMFYIFSK